MHCGDWRDLCPSKAVHSRFSTSPCFQDQGDHWFLDNYIKSLLTFSPTQTPGGKCALDPHGRDMKLSLRWAKSLGKCPEHCMAEPELTVGLLLVNLPTEYFGCCLMALRLEYFSILHCEEKTMPCCPMYLHVLIIHSSSWLILGVFMRIVEVMSSTTQFHPLKRIEEENTYWPIWAVVGVRWFRYI